MAQALYNEVIEYSDGTPATASQLAKVKDANYECSLTDLFVLQDIGTFLKWTSEPEYDDRKRMLLKAVAIFGVLAFVSYYAKRFKWSSLKSRKIVFKPKE